ncbi:MAG: lysine exporter LysO family protein, partial [Vibrio sp.]
NLSLLPIIDKFMPLDVEHHQTKLPLHKMALESAKLILYVVAGLILGLVVTIPGDWVDNASEAILLLLLFFIGIQLRNSGLTLKQIIMNKHGLMIAVVMITTSLIGGVICAWLLDLPLYQSLAMSSGFGWYSLSGILIGDAFGPVFGGASFLLELLRELVALIMIPMLILRLPNTSIGYAGATAMDFTLPIIQTTGGVRCVPIAIVSGFILSLMVPTLMVFLISMAQIQ